MDRIPAPERWLTTGPVHNPWGLARIPLSFTLLFDKSHKLRRRFLAIVLASAKL
jgi:hypothetical protein